MSAPHGGPLDSVRVVDLTQMLAGPYCTMLLADLGADVVKVEPLGGELTRLQGPFLPDDALRAFGGYFQSVNRNKRSLTVDLKTARGRDALLALIDNADVVVENFRTGVMERLGLAYESLQERNPRLVYAAIRGFGDPRTGASPYVDWPAFDVVAQAMGGLMSVTGVEEGQPLKVGPGVGDIFPATLAAVGVLGAVVKARQSGRGQFVDVAMYDGVLSLCERIVFQYDYTAEVPKPVGNRHPLLCPFGVFRAADGWVTIAAPRDHQWKLLSSLMDRPELGTDERYATNARRVAADAAVRSIISEWTQARTIAQISEVLGGLIPFGPVNTAADIAADPHVATRDMILELDHPGARQPGRVAGSPIKFTGTPRKRSTRAPLAGEHSVEVLSEAGFSEEQIKLLRDEGIVA